MPIKQVFNPLSGGFDEISQVALGTPNGLSIDANQNLSLGLSSASTTGALSSADWTTFNNKVASVAETNIRYVDGGLGNDTTGDGSLAKPWLTLTHAEASITTASSSNIFVVKIAPGTYTEGGATTLSWKPWIYLVGEGGSGAVSFNGIDFQPLGVAGGLSVSMQGLTVGSITASSFPGGATFRLDDIIVTGNINLSHRFQFQYVKNCTVSGTYFAQGDAVGGTSDFYNTHFSGNVTVDQTVSGGGAMALTAIKCRFDGQIQFGHTETAQIWQSSFTDLAISSNSKTVTLVTDSNLTQVSLGAISGATNTHFSVVQKAPDTLVNDGANYTDQGKIRTLLSNTSGGAQSVTVPTSSLRLLPLKIVNYSGANAVTVTPSSGTINGAASYTITGANSYVDIQDDGTATNNYAIIAATPVFLPPTYQSFSSGSGTYTTPTSPRPIYIKVTCIGGGGGGGSSDSSIVNNAGGGGGAGGGTCILYINGPLSATYSYSVGTGGSGGTGGGSGGTGTSTTFASGSATAQAGNGGDGASSSTSDPGVGGASGGAFGGTINFYGSSGGSGAPGAVAASGLGGNGGSSSMGGGGAGDTGGSDGGAGGQPGNNFGGGGGGGSHSDGGDGANGFIFVEEFYQ